MSEVMEQGMPDMTDGHGQTLSADQSNPIAIKGAAVQKTVTKHFPHLWPAVEAGLATCATLLLSDNVNPVALIYVGPPSAGKTTVVNMFDGAAVKGQPLCYRSDKFTPAAFVSQSAKATTQQLRHVDLLPRIRHRVLLTPELSTMFRGKEDELAERFSIITRVLDGQGLLTDSGTHGRRGYEGDYLFAWLGCTTPFQPSVWKVLAQLGSRLFFLVMDALADPSIEELIDAGRHTEASFRQGCEECRATVHTFLEILFTSHIGVRGMVWKADADPREILETIARCAKLLAVMRTPYDAGLPAQPEAPYRAKAVLSNLARGHALVYGRTQLSTEDLPLLARVTVSSMPANRRAVLLAFIESRTTSLTVREVEEAASVSRHTAEAIMEEMDWLGLTTFCKEGNGRPSHLNLKSEWEWCLEATFGSLLRQGNLAAVGG